MTWPRCSASPVATRWRRCSVPWRMATRNACWAARRTWPSAARTSPTCWRTCSAPSTTWRWRRPSVARRRPGCVRSLSACSRKTCSSTTKWPSWAGATCSTRPIPASGSKWRSSAWWRFVPKAADCPETAPRRPAPPGRQREASPPRKPPPRPRQHRPGRCRSLRRGNVRQTPRRPPKRTTPRRRPTRQTPRRRRHRRMRRNGTSYWRRCDPLAWPPPCCSTASWSRGMRPSGSSCSTRPRQRF